jgi:MFS family permease
MLVPTLGKTLGVAAGFTVAGLLLGAFAAHRLPGLFGLSSWRAAQLVLGIGSTVLLLPLLLLREPARHEREAGPGAPLKVVAGELWSRRGWVIPLFVGQTSVVMADAAAGIWAAPVLQRSYGLQPGDFAGWLGSIVLATGIVGAVVGGLAADWGQRTRVRGGLLIGAVAAAALGVPSALFAVMPGVTSFAIAIGLLLLAGTITGLVASVVLTVWLPNELRGLGIGAFISIAGLIGFGLAPTLVTIVSGMFGGEHHLDSALAIVGVAVGIISVGGFALAMRRAPVPEPFG